MQFDFGSLVDTFEDNISGKIISIEGDGFTYEPMHESMIPLAQSSQYFKSQNGDSDNTGDHGNQHREKAFPIDLEPYLAFAGAQTFADSHFFCTGKG